MSIKPGGMLITEKALIGDDMDEHGPTILNPLRPLSWCATRITDETNEKEMEDSVDSDDPEVPKYWKT